MRVGIAQLSRYPYGAAAAAHERCVRAAAPLLQKSSVASPVPRDSRWAGPHGRASFAVRSTRDGKEDEKTWADIAADAGNVAKSVFSKIKDTASSLLAPADKDRTSPPASSAGPGKPASRPRDEEQLGLGASGGLLPNLVGRAVGGLLSSAISSLGKQLEAAAKEQQGVYEDAAARIRASAKLRDRLGDVTVGPPMSQSSASTSINGRVTKQVMLVLPVYGSSGVAASAQVNVSEAPDGRSMNISVRTEDGRVILVDDAAGGGGGRGGRGSVIDVEFREVQK